MEIGIQIRVFWTVTVFTILSFMSSHDLHTVNSCLTPGGEKRCAAQQFLIVLSVTVETEGKRELQQRLGGHSDRRKQCRTRQELVQVRLFCQLFLVRD